YGIPMGILPHPAGAAPVSFVSRGGAQR
ncbi:hypothetical protein OFN54_38400, partial [Escherichia coli]|nr:hypothetical protein [Escherichia coli]